MIFSYLKIALRNLLKYRTYSFVHLIGLTIGIACLILILKYVQYETSFDSFHGNADHVYRIASPTWVQTPAPLASALRGYFPEIVNTVRICKPDVVLMAYNETRFYETRLIFADASIFDVLTFPLLSGDPHGVLSDPNSIVISEEMAHKYFGNEEPVGKTFRYDDRFDLRVTGVMSNIPHNSHLTFDCVCSIQNADKVFSPDFLENRMNTVSFTYIQLREGSDMPAVASRLDGFAKEYYGGGLYNALKPVYFLQPLTSIHLHSQLAGEFEPNGNITTVYIFSLAGLLIMLIACINYMNLTIARHMSRLKEVGIRKVVGASRTQIAVQFIGESMLLALVAAALALALAEVVSPVLGEKDLLARLDGGFAMSVIGIALLTGIASGLYPALVVSGFRPTPVSVGMPLRNPTFFGLKNMLVGFQFVISTVLIVATLTISNQLAFMSGRDLGFSREQVVVVPLQDKVLRGKWQSLKQELLKQTSVVGATASSTVPGAVRWGRSFQWEGQGNDDENTMSYILADDNFLKIYGIELVEGRDFSPAFGTDEKQGFMVNQAALEKLHWKTGVGKWMTNFQRKGTVIGVMRDFHFKSLHQKVEPLVVYIEPGEYAFLSVRIKTGDVKNALNAIGSTWRTFSGGKPFEYFFLDDYWAKLYEKEDHMRTLLGWFSALAITIACLGLFGLVAFSAENRTKEIAIRKVLGATAPGLFGLLSGELFTLVVLANLVAFPVAYYAMQRWLGDFAYRIPLGAGVFLQAGAFALVIVFLTVSYHAVRSAVANPVDSLRHE